MIPGKLLEILKQDGIVAIATLGKEGRNSGLRGAVQEKLLIIVGGVNG